MALVFLLFSVATSLAGAVLTERVFGPETATGPYKHPACLTELDNGDLYLVYYGGGGEYADATAVFGSRKRQGEARWSAPVKIASDPFRSLGNAVVWQGPDGLVWLFYVVRYGESWSTSRIQVKVSTDRAVTWTDPSVLSIEAGMMVRNRPIVLSTGEYLLPVYLETGEDREIVGPESTSRFLRFDPKTRRWSDSGVIRSAKGNIQPAVVEISPGRLLALCRRGGGYGPVTDGFMVESESRDGGRTWSEGRNSTLPNPNSAIDLIKLRSGNLLLVYNHSMTERTPLRAALSSDGGKTWPRTAELATGKNSFAYPVVLQASDGRLHLVYTSDGRRVVNHAVFDEADARAF